MDCDIPGVSAFIRFLLAASFTMVPALFAQASSPRNAANPQGTIARMPQQPYLPDGAVVRVRTTKFITSKKAKTGDPVTFRVAADVKVGEFVVIRKGALAHGRIKAAHKNGMLGRAGRIEVEVNSVDTVTGQSIALRAERSVKGEGRGVDILGAIGQTYGLGAPVFIWFRGDNVEIEAGATLNGYVDGNVAFDDAKLKASQPPPAEVTGLATVFLLRSEKHGEKNPTLYFGSVAIGQLRGRHFMEVRLPPGDYQLQSPGIETTVQLHAEPEQRYYVQFWPRSFRSAGKLELMDPIQGDDFLAYPWWAAEPKVDLSAADRAKLQDARPLNKSTGEKESAD